MFNVYKHVIEALNSLQEGRLNSVTVVNDRLKLSNGPPTKENGLYWIYTTYTDDELLASSPSQKRSSVAFASVLAQHSQLSYVCNRQVNGFRLVYNGIGGLGPKGHGGLRERILGEFRGGEGTGSLAINDSSINDLTKWKISHVLWSEINFDQAREYSKFAEIIERLWRIHYGWPVLCTR